MAPAPPPSFLLPPSCLSQPRGLVAPVCAALSRMEIALFGETANQAAILQNEPGFWQGG